MGWPCSFRVGPSSGARRPPASGGGRRVLLLDQLHSGPVGLVGRVRVADDAHREREAVVLTEGRQRPSGLAGQLGQRRAAVLGLPPGGLHQVHVLRLALGHVFSGSEGSSPTSSPAGAAGVAPTACGPPARRRACPDRRRSTPTGPGPPGPPAPGRRRAPGPAGCARRPCSAAAVAAPPPRGRARRTPRARTR